MLQGFDYYAAQNKWEHARQMYVFAQEILEQYPNQFHEESSRWHIGLAQVELRNDNTAAAKTALFAAENLLEESNLIWWQPVVQYYLGELYLQEQDVVQAKIRFRNVLTLVKNGAMPDYQALSLLALATLELDEVARLHLLEQCVATVEERARAVVYTHCMREAGLLLAASDSEYHKDLGNRCLQKVG
ncbi:MAG: hypothetical protein IAF02_07420 [Anaerolineae bacterium]|nr:hypothetical protein [Anaerolineae bacterium]